MRILCLHNYYQQPGGEDQVFAAESALLTEKGHHVVRYIKENNQIASMGRFSLTQVTLWNSAVYRELRALIRQERPQVVHLHNTFPLISPSAYYAAKAAGLPVVQTLHNYRLLCPNALFFRDGHVCEECRSRVVPWPSVLHACYRASWVTSSGVAVMITLHRLLRTWTRNVDTYIALTNFARRKFIAGGIPADKVVVKPNFLHPDPGAEEEKGKFALFVGRLSVEKGIGTLLRAWTQVRNVPLRIVGDGPLMNQTQHFCREHRLDNVHILGRQSHEGVLELIKQARLLIFPSECYESFPTVIIESFACGTPVVASRVGAASEIVEDGRTGIHFTAGSSTDLAAKVEWSWNHLETVEEMGQRARQEFEQRYTAVQNYHALMRIYRSAMGHS